MNTNHIITDTLTAGSTSLVAGAMIVPPNDLTLIHTVWIPLISGILAPLVKELILSLRENRKRKKEEQNDNESENNK